MDPAIRDRELRLWRRTSYRLHVLSWRLAFLAGALPR
ncbi:hypothetical protein PSN13_06084 [Micromonospora saelicesensis]|uniref:Uncharacterized protein n=1 Tax=Micromonospora saelicesensis TaxID=285676 RepID=A0A328NIB3_9ACTN|nr:hypothetical protein PSN13_06084 [Micromonospora saelicesensis]